MLYFDAGINWMDEGTLLTPEERILSGQAPYRDFYRIYTPGRWWLFSALFALFGRQFLITRIVWAIGHAVLAAWIYRLSRHALKPAFALIPAIAVTLAPGPWQKTPFMLGTIAGIWLIVWYASRPTIKRAAIIGLGTAIIFFFRQDAGAFYAALAGLYMLFYGKEKRLLSVTALTAAFFIPTLIWMGYLIAIGAGGEMFSTGGDFELSGTIGQPDAGMISGGSFALTGGFWFQTPFGDCDSTGNVGLVDYAELEACLTGPDGELPAGECNCFDINHDNDVDLFDVARFQQSFTDG